jgi:hypothetical protein
VAAPTAPEQLAAMSAGAALERFPNRKEGHDAKAAAFGGLANRKQGHDAMA